MLKEVLNFCAPMDKDCFNLGVHLIYIEDMVYYLRPTCHFLDLRIGPLCNFGLEDHKLRAYVDDDMLAEIFRDWPDCGILFGDCQMVMIPYSWDLSYGLIMLDMIQRIAYFCEPFRPHFLKYFDSKVEESNVRYRLHCLSMVFSRAMILLNTKWNDDIYHWRVIFPVGVPRTEDHGLSGYLVLNLLTNWNRTNFNRFTTDWSILRRYFLVELLKCTQNECAQNIPECIRSRLKKIGTYSVKHR